MSVNGTGVHMTRIREALRDHGVRLQGIELSSAPAILIEWGIIQQPERDKYQFVVEFLRRWIRRRHSLAAAKRELESVSPRAISLYEAARSAHLDGDLNTAIEDYRRALAANPNHTRAQLGLAQALYEKGTLPEAIEAYERAYDLDAASGWDGLLAARQDYAAQLRSQDDLAGAIEQYRRIWERVPEDEDIASELHDLWRQQGEAFLAGNQADSALAAVEEAFQFDPANRILAEQIAALKERQRQSEDARFQRALVRTGMLERQLISAREAQEQAELQATRMRQLAAALAALAAVTALLTGLPPLVRVTLAGLLVSVIVVLYRWHSNSA
jgi:tetratricopeptide (TPR) repeat protein